MQTEDIFLMSRLVSMCNPPWQSWPSKAKLAPNHPYTTQTYHLRPLEVCPQPQHAILGPRFPSINVVGEVGPLAFSRLEHAWLG